jgi:serine/threonine-protein kinase
MGLRLRCILTVLGLCLAATTAWLAEGAGGDKGKGDPPPMALPVPPPNLAAQVKDIFRRNCFECHGGGTKVYGKFRVFDHEALLKENVVARKPEDSPLFKLISVGGDSGMPPPGRPALKKDEVELVRQWIAEGALPFPQEQQIPAAIRPENAFKNLVGVDYVHNQILAHINTFDPAVRPFKRYFSINHILAAGAPPDSPELILHAHALAVAINHLSLAPKLVQPLPIDPAKTIFCVDLRALGWDRQPWQRYNDDGSKKVGPSHLNLWDLILLEYPYSTVYTNYKVFDDLARDFLVPAHQVRPIVYVRADWFVSRMLFSPFYEDFLDLPRRIEQLDAYLGLDPDALPRGKVRRAGLAVSGVSINNRVVERTLPHPEKTRYYWKSYDYRSGVGSDNIFIDPIYLRPTGGEMIFGLPNGMQAYFVVNAKGDRVGDAPTEIVRDKRFAEDAIVRNGLSCIRCHDRGTKNFEDDMRRALLKLPDVVGFDKTLALDIYPEQAELDKYLQDDGKLFVDAMTELLGKGWSQYGPSPVIPVAARFLDAPLPLMDVAGELGLPDAEPLRIQLATPQFAMLGLMPLVVPPEGKRLPGVVRRDAWEDYYGPVVRNLGLGMPVIPLDGLLCRDYPPSSYCYKMELKTNLRNLKPGDKLEISVTNKYDRPMYIELIGRSPQGEMQILIPSTTLLPVGQTKKWSAPTDGQPGREQVILYASPEYFPPGYLVCGKYVSDRVVHDYYHIKASPTGRPVIVDCGPMIKQTLDIETK